MAPIDCDDLNSDDDAASAPELDALAECLRREACELSAMYPPGSAELVQLEQLASTHVPRRALIWRAGAAVAVLVVCATTWTAIRHSLPQFDAPHPRRAVRGMAVGMDDRVRRPSTWPTQSVPEVMPILPSHRVGAHDMNGPEIEAVLNLLEDNRTSLKLAL